MFRLIIGAFIGAILVYNSAEDSCDSRLKAIFNPDNYKAMQKPWCEGTKDYRFNCLGGEGEVRGPVPLHR